MPTDPFKVMTAALRRIGGQRVWSQMDLDWPVHCCHILVWDLLSRFSAPSLADLDKSLWRA